MSGPTDSRIEELAVSLKQAVRGRLSREEPIARFTSFRLGGPAMIFLEPADAEDLQKAAELVAASGIAVLAIGRGTNLLISDRGFPGVVMRLGESFDWIKSSGTSVTAGAATALPQVANRAARLSLAGLEFSIAIPATVGGAVRMNAGAHGSSISDVLGHAVICRLDRAALEEVPTADLKMSYRRTALGDSDVVCSARFDLVSTDRDTILNTMASYRTHRTQTQPVDAPNAGSMFMNPNGDAAGRLIEAAGLKGFRVGGAEVSRKHANFFLAHPSATAQDVFDLMAHVQKTVAKVSGTRLQPEVRLVGEFDRGDTLISGNE